MVKRKQWDPNRRFVVTVGSRWKRDDMDLQNVWVVTELWRFEQGSGRELLAVTIKCGKTERHMSQARLLNVMREVAR
jgi:hypothetical protein